MARTIVVTGSASGIGAATTRLLRERGDRVIGVDLAGADIDADLATPEGRDAMVAAVTEASGGTVDAVWDAFMASPSHAANVLDPAFTRIGGGRPNLRRCAVHRPPFRRVRDNWCSRFFAR